jgi:hypothetical protein
MSQRDKLESGQTVRVTQFSGKEIAKTLAKLTPAKQSIERPSTAGA